MALLPRNTSLGQLRIVEIYAEHDFPVVFVSQNASGQVFIATWIAETEESTSWLYTGVSAMRLGDVRAGRESLRNVFTAPELRAVFSVTVPKGGAGDARAVAVPQNLLTDDLLPSQDAFVDPEAVQIVGDAKAQSLLQSDDDAEILLDGDPVENNTVQIDFLGRILSTVQSMANAIGQTIRGEPTERAPVPRETITASRLFMTAFLIPGSFGFRLRLPAENVNDAESRRIIDLVAETFSQEIPGQQQPWRESPRVRTHYATLLELIAKQGAVVTVRSRGNPHGISVNSRQARERIASLAERAEVTIDVAGILTGGSIETSRFEVRVNERRYSGKSSAEARAQLNGLPLGSRVQVRIRQINKTSATGDVKSSFVLLSIAAAVN